MSPQNLTNVYNQNPTLQSNYTLQQYLDLFGGSSTTPTTTAKAYTSPTTQSNQGIIGVDLNQGGGGGEQGINNVVGTTSVQQYANPGIKAYGPGGKLEVNPTSFGMSFYNAEPQAQKDAGFMDRFMGAAVPGRSLSSFASPTTGGTLTGPAELGFMTKDIQGLPGITRENMRSMYDNYNKLAGRKSNYEMARVKGTLGKLVGMIPYIGPIKRGAEAMFGPAGDTSLQSRFTVDNAGYGNTGARDEFGLATFDKKDGFLGLTGNTTRNYADRMNDKINDLQGFFEKAFDKRGKTFDIENLDLETMKSINGFNTKQFLAYKNRLTSLAKSHNKSVADFLEMQKIAAANKISKQQAAAVQQAIKDERGTPGSADYGNPGGTSGAMTDANAGTYCFDPSTPIQMADGSTKEIKNIQLGDDTKGGEVTGVFQFKASDEIHDYKGVTVAGSHYVKEDGEFIMVKDSPLSVKIDKIPVVYSLDTKGRRIFINDIEFADYNGDGVAKSFLSNAGVDLTGFDKEVLRQVEHRLI